MWCRFPKNHGLMQKELEKVYKASLDLIQGKPTVALPVSAINLPIPLSPVKNVQAQHALESMLVHYGMEGDTFETQAVNLVCKILQENGCLLKSHVHEIFRHQASQGIFYKSCFDLMMKCSC